MMVDVQLLQTISVITASAGVFAAAIYYILQIRHQTRIRQMDLVTRLYSHMTSKEFLEAWEKVRDRETMDYREYKEKYGLLELNQVYGAFEEVGILLQRKLIDTELANALFGGAVIVMWEKIKPIVEFAREQRQLHALEGFEYLYNKMKKREQKLQQSKV